MTTGLLARAHNIEDLRLMARSRLPRGLFEFVDRGAEDEVSLRGNTAAFARIGFRPKVMRDITHRSTRTTLLGRTLPFPAVIAPTGAVGLMWYGGEVAAARAAAEMGIPYTLATGSIAPIEQVAAEAGGDLWFQLYAWPRMELSLEIVRRAKAAGFRTLVLTADTAVMPNREYNQRNGFSVPLRASLRNSLDVLRHPRWFAQVMVQQMLRGGVPEFVNLPKELRSDLRGKGSPIMPPNVCITPDIMARLRDVWEGPILIKGVLGPEDAANAIACGMDGIVVSNHGGRNLDGAIPTIEALPAIVEVVQRRIPVLLDSGVRRGADIVKALALGADGVLLGRAPLWGTAVAGQPGAHRALEILQTEMHRVMGQLGVSSVADIDRRAVHLAGDTAGVAGKEGAGQHEPPLRIGRHETLGRQQP